jgi:hypothetical protein
MVVSSGNVDRTLLSNHRTRFKQNSRLDHDDGPLAQIVLAVGVVALLAERIPTWLNAEDRAHQLEEELAARQSTQEQIDRVHQQLGATG